MRKKIIYLIPCITLLICLIFQINIFLIILFLTISVLFCISSSRKEKTLFFKTINVSKLNKYSSGILIGKKNNKVLLTDDDKVLIVDKKSTLDYLDINLKMISNFSNKPNMIVIDPNRELYNNNYEYLKRKKYEISSYNLSNTFIDIFKIITNKMYAIKDLEIKVNNVKGQYVKENEIFLSYDDIRKEIRKYKEDIKVIIKEFINCYFNYMTNNIEFLPLYSLLLVYIEKKIYQEKIVEVTFNNVISFLLDKTSCGVAKIKKYLCSSEDEEFFNKEELFKNKRTKFNWDLVMKNIMYKVISIKENLQNMEVVNLEGFYTDNEIFFITGNNEKSLKLFLFLLNYTHIEKNLYLLINSNAFYELTLEKLKVIHVVTEIKNIEGVNDYSVKIYRGKTTNENKKEVLRLCRKDVDEVQNKDYERIFSLLKQFDKMNDKKNEVLIITPRKGNVIINFDFPKKDNVLMLDYYKKY